jgi:predicted nuclease of predicted toxin-antitoxin system
VRWLADECIAAGVVAKLRSAGQDVAYIAEIAPSLTDTEVIALAQSEGRLYLTDDKDIGELVFRRAREIPGVVLVRIDPAKQALQWLRLEHVIDRYGPGLYGRYTVIEAGRFRSRRLPSSAS